MFIEAHTDLNSWYLMEGLYKNKNPHIIYDDNFEVCLLFIDTTDLIGSFLKEFIWLYDSKKQNIEYNLVCFLKWVKCDVYHYEQAQTILKNKYPQYIEDIEKYLLLI